MGESSTTVTVKIEIPKGSRNKYEFDEAAGAFRFDRMLFSAGHYPSIGDAQARWLKKDPR